MSQQLGWSHFVELIPLEDYIKQEKDFSIVVVDRQFLKSGVRLAGILDRALGTSESSEAVP